MKGIEMEIRELKYFVNVAKTGNLTKAATALFVSQPTLSKAIKKLENTIGAPLFVRKKNQLELTDMGRELLKKSQTLLRDYDDILKGIQDVQDVNSGYISIDLPPCTIPLLFNNIFLEFKASHPKISLFFRENGVDAVIKNLSQGEAELGIIIQEFPHKNIIEVPIFSGDMVAVAHKKHHLSSHKFLDFIQLKDERLCILQDDYLIAKQTRIKCHEAGFEPIISCSNGNCDFLVKVAHAQNEVAIIPRPIFLENDYPDMIDIPFSIHWPWTVCLAWRKDAYMTRAAESLKNLIFSHFPPLL